MTDSRPPTAKMMQIRADKDAYVEALAKCGTVGGALDAIGRTHAWVRWHREKDPAFADAEREAFARHADTLEQTAIDRATGRKLRHVTYKGQLQYQHDPRTGELLLDDHGNPVPVMEEVVSDRLLEQQLEAVKPEKYTKTRRLDARIAVAQIPHQVSHSIASMTIEQQDEVLALIDGRLDEVSPETLLLAKDILVTDADFTEVEDDDDFG